MEHRSAIEQPIGALLKPLGFKKHRLNWHLLGPETVLVLNIQKSQWGPTSYVNLGVYLRALGGEQTPPEYRCHIRTRLDPLLDDPSPLLAVLDLESGLSLEQRVETLRHHILSSALPWLHARESEAKARAALLAEQRPTGLVMGVALQHLGITGAA